ncbi:MAG: hypothetical protein JRD04_03765 [Deltaproteobacteria bacterium]|nr:hypothetical protein [Deltaproteobacteria bacterium]
MKLSKHPHLWFGLFFACLLLLTLGCEKEMTDPKGVLEKQAAQYWTERLVNKNYQYTYKEEAKAGLPPFETYENLLKAAARVPTSSVKTKEVKIEGDIGIVTLSALCRIPGVPKDMALPIGDRWILKGNQWRHHFQVKSKEKK